jgi:hypothetical protein
MTWREPNGDDRRIAALWAVCAGLAIALRPIWFAMMPLLPGCPFHRLTGIACPGCGTTRAVARLLRCDVAGGFAMNPLSLTGAVAFLLGGALAPAWLALGGAVPEPSPGPKWGWGIVAALGLGLNWAWLVASGV